MLLFTIDTLEAGSEVKADQVKSEYEKKISNLMMELTKLKSAQKEHNKLLKEKVISFAISINLHSDLYYCFALLIKGSIF